MRLKKDQVYLALKKSILNGQLASGSKLPREVDFARQLNVGQVTLRAALTKLEEAGLVKRLHGRGTFIAKQSKPVTQATIMVVHNSLAGFEAPCHYIDPAISHAAEKIALHSFVTTNQAIEMHSANTIKTFISKNNIIGIILTMNNFNGNEPIVELLSGLEVPIIIAHAHNNDLQNTGFACIMIDEKSGWQTAIAHLATQRHTDIAVLGNNQKVTPFRGYSKNETMQLLEQYGITSNPAMIFQVGLDRIAIKKIVKDLMLKTSPPTAILCYSDFYAVYVYEALDEMKLTVPNDVAVMGVCGFPDAKFISPPLSTIDYGYAELGEMATEMVMEPKKWFDAKTGRGKLRMKPFQLRVRKSTQKTTKENKNNIDYSIQQVENVAFA